MAIISGIWKFKDTALSGQSYTIITDKVNFKSNGNLFTTMVRRGQSYNSKSTYVLNYDSTTAYYFSGYYTNQWNKESYKIIDFGSAQTVTDSFYTWFTSNAVQQTSTTIRDLPTFLIYTTNAIREKTGTTASINAQMIPDKIRAIPTPLPTQSKTTTPTKSSQTISPDNGYVLSSVVVNAIPSNYIIPTNTLEITSNGEQDVTNYAKVNVNVESSGGVDEDTIYTELLNGSYGSEQTVNITLRASNGGLNNQTEVAVKFGSQPSDESDSDYYSYNGSILFDSKNDTYITADNLKIDVAPVAYIWQRKDDTLAGYSLNGKVFFAGVGYANATKVDLKDGDIIALRSTGLD